MASPPTGASRNTTVLEADVACSASTSYQNLTGLSFSVITGERYRFYALILFNAALATTGMRLAATGPAGTIAYNARIPNAAAADTIINGNANDLGTVPAQSPFTTGNIAEISGICIPSADGTFQLRFAPEVATGSAITILKGSTLEVW